MAHELAIDPQEITQRLTRRFGPGIAGWCAGISALVGAMTEEWALEPGEPFPAGNSSVAIRCTRSDGSPAVLKLSPDLTVVAEQVETLRLFAAGGRVPAVLAANVGTGAVLLELIEPGTRADELQPPPSARDWASLLSALQMAPVPAGYPRDLRAQCEGFFDRIGRRVSEPEIGRWVSAADVARGAIRCEALLAPRACVGDPCFDAVDYLLDGAGRAGVDGDDGIDARCVSLAAASGLDAGRLYAWCRAVAPIVAITYVMRPGSQAAVAELLALASE